MLAITASVSRSINEAEKGIPIFMNCRKIHVRGKNSRKEIKFQIQQL